MDDLHKWLSTEVGAGYYAVYTSRGLATDALGVYLRDIEGARALIAAFPDLILADGTENAAYTSPVHAGVWQSEELFGVCNLYAMTKAQDAVRELFDGLEDKAGNLPSLPGIYPDYEAPVVSNGDDGPRLSMMRWGMPSPAFALKGKKTDRGVTNVRNTKSPHWRRWMGVKNRCVVPFTSFSEPHNQSGQPSEPVWFALSEDRPSAFFAGIWTEWTSVRKLKDGETTDNLFGFLTTEANADVGAIHPKAMPVILTAMDEVELWLHADTEQALSLQRPLPDGMLQIVGRGCRQDDAGASV
ncbi:SOS response-associated peptidase [Cognatiyoonia sp. IB215182]|uniref:SOS response-associated peptidase n=1 Tax=Cognatiyoonia sp. IB215182 TaxID=3097353 RepID=UPI002A1685BD|nr:SOS response-associated peptidase [Cognatiyoonia sp. IB215182]MDX8355278.1 SOS response-associated peptidase [Cognatiyoonia sp. IB215182]